MGKAQVTGYCEAAREGHDRFLDPILGHEILTVPERADVCGEGMVSEPERQAWLLWDYGQLAKLFWACSLSLRTALKNQ